MITNGPDPTMGLTLGCPPPPLRLGGGNQWCPDDFICPITLEQLKDPVVAADGLTYEREALQNGFASTGLIKWCYRLRQVHPSRIESSPQTLKSWPRSHQWGGWRAGSRSPAEV